LIKVTKPDDLQKAVEEVQAALADLQGRPLRLDYDPADPESVHLAERAFEEALDQRLQFLRIAVVQQWKPTILAALKERLHERQVAGRVKPPRRPDIRTRPRTLTGTQRPVPRLGLPGPLQDKELLMAEKDLNTLFHEGLKDIYYAERKILKALPKMARGARSQELKAAFQEHREQTQGQLERLQRVFELIGKRAQGKTCSAIDGIIEEGEELLDEFKGQPAIDAGLLAAAQAVEHYEIARYGTLKRWATVLGLDDAAELLGDTLSEESDTDEKLTELADASVNGEAVAAE